MRTHGLSIMLLATLAGATAGWAQVVAPGAPAPAGGGPRVPVYRYALSPKPVPPTPWTAPNRPHWKLAEILAAHARQARWTQPVIRDGDYSADYIQMAPGERTPTAFHADKTVFWVVQAGQMRVTIEGQEPFTASKGFAIWVPARLPYHMETVGDGPSLRFEVRHTGSTPIYPTDQTPPPTRGVNYVRVAYASAPGTYPAGIKPYLDFNAEYVNGPGRTGRFIPDASFIRGRSAPTPPADDRGHFHIDYNEFWFVMEGKMTYQIEGAGVFTADQGDVVYAPNGHFHRTSFAGGGMATRLAVFPNGGMNNLEGEHPSPSQPQ